MPIDRVGVWGPGTWLQPDRRDELVAFAREVEALGYASLWMSTGFDDGVPEGFAAALEATSTLRVVPGILSIWHSTAEQTARAYHDLESRYPGRFLAGIGASHAPFAQARGASYAQPYSAMVAYLDELDALGVPPQGRVLAALGPKMLTLAAQRSVGAHPYLIPVAATAHAREVMGEQGLLLPEVTVALEPDPARARALAREFMSMYLTLPNYINNLERYGFTVDDVADGGSDRLIDALVGWGDATAVVTRINEHLSAGADEVLIQVLHSGAPAMPTEQVATIARELAG